MTCVRSEFMTKLCRKMVSHAWVSASAPTQGRHQTQGFAAKASFPTQELSVTTFEIPMQVPLTTLQAYNSPKANYDGILSYLLDFDYSLSLQSQDVTLVWHTIKNSIYNAMDTFISKVGLRWHQFPCWYTPELRHLSKWLHTSKKQFSKHPLFHLQLRMNNPESEYRSKILHA